MRERGVWPFKQRWTSLCSAHRRYNPSCNTCNSGSWEFYVSTWLGSKLYKASPKIWKWWMNLPVIRGRWLKKMQYRKKKPITRLREMIDVISYQNENKT